MAGKHEGHIPSQIVTFRSLSVEVAPANVIGK
jgi:hypothetical protein